MNKEKSRPKAWAIWYHLPFPSVNKGEKNKKAKEKYGK